MARFDLAIAHSIIFPDRDDSSGLRRCRYCGKLIPVRKRGRVFWCDDHCYYESWRMVSWEHTRQAAYDRDGGVCQMCGTKVSLYKRWFPTIEEELKFIRPEFHGKYYHYFEGVRQAEIHHVTPMSKLMDLAYKVTEEIQDEARRTFWLYKLGVMLQLDLNNLTTLCMKPCHDEVHNRENNLKRKRAENDKIWESVLQNSSN